MRRVQRGIVWWIAPVGLLAACAGDPAARTPRQNPPAREPARGPILESPPLRPGSPEDPTGQQINPAPSNPTPSSPTPSSPTPSSPTPSSSTASNPTSSDASLEPAPSPSASDEPAARPNAGGAPAWYFEGVQQTADRVRVAARVETSGIRGAREQAVDAGLKALRQAAGRDLQSPEVERFAVSPNPAGGYTAYVLVSAPL